MNFTIKAARLAVLLASALALAAPAFAALTDSEEPGSVIVFPKFIQGATTTLEGTNVPITELKIGIVCPKGVTCAQDQPVTIEFHWVCGTTEAASSTSFVCQETNFFVTATVFEKIVLTPNGESVGFYTTGGLNNVLPTHFASAANCPNGGGYLVGWVVNNSTNPQPVKFDGLIGEAHLRPGSPAAPPPNPFAGSPLALASYNAIPIQADPALATFPAAGSTIATVNGGLVFDGGAGHYAKVTGQVMGDIRYTNLTTGPTFTLGVITLLTLDVLSNRPNNPVFVDFVFYGGNPSNIGNESPVSTSTDFICWEEIPITAIVAGGVNLNTTTMGREGVFVSDQAKKVALQGVKDKTGPVTLLGLSETLEGGFFPPVGA